MKNIFKRDGKSEVFNTNKIKNAVKKSGANDEVTEYVTATAAKYFENKQDITINEIQSKIEDLLMTVDQTAARKYIEYRHDRDKKREMSTTLHQQIMGLMTRTDKETLDSNANKDSRVLHTQRDLLAGIICKHYGLNHVLPKNVAKAHNDGTVYFHDLDYSPFFPITNCCLVDLKFMFDNGFKMGAAEIETPKSITTATALTAQVIAQVASSQYGGTTIGDIDIVLAPYVRMTYVKHLKNAQEFEIIDMIGYAQKMTENDVMSAMQGLLYEVNTLHTSNGQSPFVTFGFGLGDTWEAKLIQKGIIKNQMQGLGKNKVTPVFPKLVYAVKEGHNAKEGDAFYDVKKLAVECTSKRFYPDFLSYKNNLSITGSDKITFPMGCRAYLAGWKDPETSEYVTHSRNNLGVISVNLPYIALESNGNINKFYKILDERLAIAYDALWVRINSLKNTTASVAPILYMEGAFGVKMKADDPIIDLFKNGRASISLGYIGCHEMANVMFKDEPHAFESQDKQNFIKGVIAYMFEATKKWKAETGYGFTLYATPSESLCHTFLTKTRKKFGVINDVTDKEYFTNSFHLDVLKQVTPFEKFEFEKEFHWISPGGHISYAEYSDMKHNLKGLETCIDYALDQLSYVGTNLPTDKCFTCGSDDEFVATVDGYHCSECGENHPDKISVIRRTCGYIGNAGSIPYNIGKQDEITKRYKHSKKLGML